jgi:hypothetical protein
MSDKRMLIVRTDYGKRQTKGQLYLYDGFAQVLHCATLELPWLENTRQISCIPEGCYEVVKRESAKFAEHFHITNIPNRSYVLIHAGNFYTQIEGCILVGSKHRDINHDGLRDVVHSKVTLHKILNEMPESFTLKITSI